MKIADGTKVRVDILGQEYVLKGAESPEYLEMLGKLVAGKMDQVYRSNASYGPTRVAVLVSFQIADELNKLKEDYEKIVEELRILDKIHKTG